MNNKNDREKSYITSMPEFTYIDTQLVAYYKPVAMPTMALSRNLFESIWWAKWKYPSAEKTLSSEEKIKIARKILLAGKGFMPYCVYISIFYFIKNNQIRDTLFEILIKLSVNPKISNLNIVFWLLTNTIGSNSNSDSNSLIQKAGKALMW